MKRSWRTSICIVVLLLTPIVGLHADTIHTVTWEKTSLPFEASVYNLDVVWLYDPHSKSIFTGEDKKGLFKSQDGGRSWRRVDDGSFRVQKPYDYIDTLKCEKDALYSLVPLGAGTRIIESVVGKSWKPLWVQSKNQTDEVWGRVSRLWIDHRNKNKMYTQTMRYAEAPSPDSPEVARQLWSTDDSWNTYQKIAMLDEWTVGSTDVYDGKICFVESGEQIKCSVDNGITWTRLSLSSISALIVEDKKNNYEPIINFDKTNGEIVIHWGRYLFKTKNKWKDIEKILDVNGRLMDLIFHPLHTYPIYGIVLDNSNEPWKVARIDASGSIDLFPGPKEKGFRLKAVDFSTSAIIMWGSSETFRGVLK